MDKSLKIILSLISLLLALQFVLIFILFNREPAASATRSCPNQVFSSISSERAKEVALDYIRHGTAGDVTLVNRNGGQIYSVNISYGDIHYVIYVHGETGDVVWLTREEIGYEGVITLPEDLSSSDVLY